MTQDELLSQRDHDLLIEMNTTLKILLDIVKTNRIELSNEIVKFKDFATEEHNKLWTEIDSIKQREASRTGFFDGAKWMWGVIGMVAGFIPPSVLFYLISGGK